MANRKVSIYILASYNGRRRWFKHTYRGRLPKLETVIEGKAQPLPNGVFYLRHGSGKDRNWDRIGNQGDVALNALQRQSQRLAAKAAGLALADEPDKHRHHRFGLISRYHHSTISSGFRASPIPFIRAPSGAGRELS